MSTVLSLLFVVLLCLAVLAFVCWPLLALSSVWAYFSAREDAERVRDMERVLAGD
ncbi:hypothetical protein [uncultured Xylophilus sp.]|uniref:hypothetical protein n=1 Tax=uncultured Xylophilus sp. TaxID=296832 RepID=UPI0025D4DE25|nr:hypothetical protein [uncultured Xylophilus sp.]